MATYNFNVKITTGKKTDLSVQVASTLYNTSDKVVKFKDQERELLIEELEYGLETAIIEVLSV